MLLPIDDLNYDSAKLVDDFLSTIVSHGRDHEVVRQYRTKGKSGQYAFSLRFADGFQHTLNLPYFLTWDVANRLTVSGHMEQRGEAYPFTLHFTREAIEDYRSRRVLSDVEIRKALGQHLLDQYQDYDEPQGFDQDEVAAAIGVSIDRLNRQVRLLKGRKLISQGGGLLMAYGFFDDGPITAGPATPTTMSLTSDLGLAWAMGGFQDHVSPSVDLVVNVQNKIDVTPLIEYLRQAQIGDEERTELVELAEEFQERPTSDTVQKIFDIGANATQVTTGAIWPLMQVIANNIEPIGRILGKI